ncbi:ELAV-like protein 1 isoform X2 [Tachypleus tridentatus]|uniref:ELAV-like protein 1 isoform X2 n=1 Tax=Tachypleus tridentatus TaxID=6853 RepID=UPI003FD002C1
MDSCNPQVRHLYVFFIFFFIFSSASVSPRENQPCGVLLTQKRSTMEGDNQETRTNLIINYLPQTLTDDEFRSLFQTIGSIKTCKIVRHKSTGYSYGFGFVDYNTPVDAARAIQTLNGFQMQNKKIKVAYARPSGDEIKNANLYVRGIPATATQEDIELIFGKYGQIIQCRILKDDVTKKSKGIAFVLYDLREEAEEAINNLNGQVLPGGSMPLNIKFAEDNAKKVQATGPTMMLQRFASPFRGAYGGGGPMRQGGFQNRYRYNPMMYGMASTTIGEPGYILFVYNIGTETDEKSLWQLFSTYGTVQKVNVIREAATGISKGYGFVTMLNYEDAVLAIESLNGFLYAGKPLQVSFKTQK